MPNVCMFWLQTFYNIGHHSYINAIVCYNKAGKICDEEKTEELDPSAKEAYVDEYSTCVDVFDTGKLVKILGCN